MLQTEVVRQYLANYLVFVVDTRSVLSGERAEAEESVDDPA